MRESQHQVIDFWVACGPHGIVWPVNTSGFPALTDEERLKGMRGDRADSRAHPGCCEGQGVSRHRAAMSSRRVQDLRLCTQAVG